MIYLQFLPTNGATSPGPLFGPFDEVFLSQNNTVISGRFKENTRVVAKYTQHKWLGEWDFVEIKTLIKPPRS